MGSEPQGTSEAADGARAATVLRPGEGEAIRLGASSATLKATSADTAGTLFLSETVIERGFPGPPPHVNEAPA